MDFASVLEFKSYYLQSKLKLNDKKICLLLWVGVHMYGKLKVSSI